LEGQFEPMRQGGTGTESSTATQPQAMPHLCEAGNLNVPALAGLAAAVEWLADKSVEQIAQHSRQLTSQLLEGLARIEGVQVFGPTANQPRVGVVSFAARGYDPQEFAACLDASCGVECRAGLHCAPRMHEALGTIAHGGLVRLSPGWCTTTGQIELTLAAIADLAAAAP
jgi:selenocysteine lyase/cysteine desulfurase